MSATIAELSTIVRSKNAGPFRLTLDVVFRDAETFLSLAEEALGVAAQAALPLRSTG